MRLPLISPEKLTPTQKSLYDEMRKGIARDFNAFAVEREDGALMGPWNPWLHDPAIGKAIWDFTLAMTADASLPDNVRQIAILVVAPHRFIRVLQERGVGLAPRMQAAWRPVSWS
jgi:4-carboxymuconolactone decarboxylase